MGKMQRTKGAAGEREIVGILKSWGFIHARRTAPMQSGGGYHRSLTEDISYPDVEGVPGYFLEVKRQEKTSIWKWLKQALKDCPQDKTPLVVFRRSRSEWYVALEFEELLDLIRVANDMGELE